MSVEPGGYKIRKCTLHRAPQRPTIFTITYITFQATGTIGYVKHHARRHIRRPALIEPFLRDGNPIKETARAHHVFIRKKPSLLNILNYSYQLKTK